jgi:hypothetical protein
LWGLGSSGDRIMDNIQLLELLMTGSFQGDSDTLSTRILEMNEHDVKEVVIDYIYLKYMFPELNLKANRHTAKQDDNCIIKKEERLNIMNKVLWNNEMDYCIGLTTELSKEDFIEEASKTHIELTGEELDLAICEIDEVADNVIWRLELSV